MTAYDPLTQHERLIAELDRQKQLREDAPKREKAMELARQPVDISRYRSERNLMLYPFCATARRKRINGILYKTSDRKHWLEVIANAKYGMAKIWDFDILRFALSKAGEIAREVGYFPEVVEFAGYECLKAIGRCPKSGKNHEWLKEALLRLSTTAYHSNIFTDGDERSVFTLVKVNYRQDSNDGFVKVCMRFDQRLIDSAYQHRGLLAIDKAVLHEEAGIKKRLLELVTISKGKEASWTVGLKRLQAMCAHEGELWVFKRELKQYELPWKVTFLKAVGGGENITFSETPHRNSLDGTP